MLVAPRVTVLEGFVAPPLQVQCPGLQTVASPDGQPVAPVYPAPRITGGLAPYGLTYDPPAGTPLPVGVTTPVWVTVASADGQTMNCSFPIFVTPPTPPIPPTPGDLGGYRPEMPAQHGMASVGGRGPGGVSPVLIKVTSRLDTGAALSGPSTVNGMSVYTGELRAALQFNGPRFIVFEVSGYITLTSQLNVMNPYVTVAGQTAPAPGVSIRGSGTFGTDWGIHVGTHNSVWQHLRIRPGDNFCNSALVFWNFNNGAITVERHLIDHCSISWFQDEGIVNLGPARDVTLWKSIVAESLHQLPGSETCSGGGKDNGHGVLHGRGAGLSIIQCLLANNWYRNPQVGGGSQSYVANNIIYGCDLGAFYNNVDPTNTTTPVLGDNVGNYYRRNNEALFEPKAIACRFLISGSRLHIADNVYDNGPTLPNWIPFQVINNDGIDPRVGAPTGVAPTGYTRLTATAAYSEVLNGAGCRPKFRATADNDGVDTRVITNVINRQGTTALQSIAAVGGYPALANNSNTFAMPANPLGVADAVGRLNIEVYLETLARALEPAAVGALAVTCPPAQTASTSGSTATVNYPPATTTGGLAPVTLSYSHPSGSSFPVGTTTVTVTAQSADFQTATCQFPVTVTATSSSPVITTLTLPDPAVGVFYQQTIAVSGGTGPLVFAVASGALPAGLALNTSSGVIAGTPTTAGSASFTIRVTDANGVSDTQAYTVVVSRLTIVTNVLPTGSPGTFYSVPISITGGTPPYVLTRVAGTFPTGISIVGTALQGTPTTAQATSFTLRATDSVGNTADQSFTLVISAEGPHDFYNALLLRSDHLTHFSFRDQALIDAAMDGASVQIIRSSAASPTTLDCGVQPVTILNSADGVITLSGGNPVPVDGTSVEIVGHTLAALNGVHAATRLNSTQIRIDGITGSGTGGTMYRAMNWCHDQALIVLSGHSAIPNGTYVATRLNIRQLQLRTTAGAPVSSSGGGNSGLYRVKCWEHFPTTGRTDPDASPNKDAAKGVIPVLYGSDILRQIHLDYNVVGQAVFTVWDTWHASNLRQDLTGPKVASKVYRHDGVSAGAGIRGTTQDWLLYPGRQLRFASVTPGSPTAITLRQEHYFTSGDQVAISGNGSIPDGTYTITVTGSKSFTIPAATVSGSVTGFVEHTLEIGRVNATFPATVGLIWYAGYADVADNRSYPTGLNGAPMAAGYIGSAPIFANRWTRRWYYFLPNLTGHDSVFADWNAANVVPHFGAGRKVGVWNISLAVDGSGVGTVTCLDGPHGYRPNEQVMLTGIAGLSGPYTVFSVPTTPTATSSAHGGFTGPSTFTITGLPAGLTGTGQVAVRLAAMSVWLADELREPIPIFDRIPTHNLTRMDFFRHEWDSSNDSQPMPDGQVHFYQRNTVALVNPSGVALTNTGLFRRPVA